MISAGKSEAQYSNTIALGDLERPWVVAPGLDNLNDNTSNAGQSTEARVQRRRKRRRHLAREQLLRDIRNDPSRKGRSQRAQKLLDHLRGNEDYDGFDEDYDDDDDEAADERFIELEFKRLMSSISNRHKLTKRQLKVRNRTLNYWRRFRLRRMGIDRHNIKANLPETM